MDRPHECRSLRRGHRRDQRARGHAQRIHPGAPPRPSHVDDRQVAQIAGGETVGAGDVIVTRRNDRTIRSADGESIRNRERWRVGGVGVDGSLDVSRLAGRGQATLSAEYARSHVRLGYASTAHKVQGETADVSYTLITESTTHRSLYVGATRGRDANHLAVITESPDLDDARDTLEWVLANDRADVPAVVRRCELAEAAPPATSPDENLKAAQAAFTLANSRAAPARELLEEAMEELRSAERKVSGLEADLRSSRPWERRSIRRDLAGAKGRVVEARTRHQDAGDEARPWLDGVDHALQELDNVRAETDIELMLQRLDALAREVPSRGGLSR